MQDLFIKLFYDNRPEGQCHLDNDIGQKAKETDYHRMVVSLLACRENYQQTGIRNRQMFPSVSKKCTIQLLGYSVEEAYCRLEFDFARVGSSRSDRKELPADEGFHIRRGSFSYGKEITANVNGAGKVQLIIMFSFPIALSNKRSGSNRFTKVVENQTSPDFLLDVVTFFRMKVC